MFERVAFCDTSLQDLKGRYPDAGWFDFGDAPELSTQLIELVRTGRKTATCAALRAYDADPSSLPKVGRYEIVLDYLGRPALVLRMTWVQIMRFCDVDWSFARHEGEDEDLEGWRTGHRAFFSRNGGFDPLMMLVCQRFQMVEDISCPSCHNERSIP